MTLFAGFHVLLMGAAALAASSFASARLTAFAVAMTGALIVAVCHLSTPIALGDGSDRAAPADHVTKVPRLDGYAP